MQWFCLQSDCHETLFWWRMMLERDDTIGRKGWCLFACKLPGLKRIDFGPDDCSVPDICLFLAKGWMVNGHVSNSQCQLVDDLEDKLWKCLNIPVNYEMIYMIYHVNIHFCMNWFLNSITRYSFTKYLYIHLTHLSAKWFLSTPD